jgi:hypothetical protein
MDQMKITAAAELFFDPGPGKVARFRLVAHDLALTGAEDELLPFPLRGHHGFVREGDHRQNERA